MNKRLIWVEGHDFTGWCCSHCTLGITAPHLESTVAALAFNRLAQETFEKHICAETGHDRQIESAGGSRLFSQHSIGNSQPFHREGTFLHLWAIRRLIL